MLDIRQCQCWYLRKCLYVTGAWSGKSHAYGREASRSVATQSSPLCASGLERFNCQRTLHHFALPHELLRSGNASRQGYDSLTCPDVKFR
jgi:hypothetical protein